MSNDFTAYTTEVICLISTWEVRTLISYVNEIDILFIGPRHQLIPNDIWRFSSMFTLQHFNLNIFVTIKLLKLYQTLINDYFRVYVFLLTTNQNDFILRLLYFTNQFQSSFGLPWTISANRVCVSALFFCGSIDRVLQDEHRAYCIDTEICDCCSHHCWVQFRAFPAVESYHLYVYLSVNGDVVKMCLDGVVGSWIVFLLGIEVSST